MEVMRACSFRVSLCLMIFGIEIMTLSATVTGSSYVAHANETDRIALLFIKAQINSNQLTSSWNESLHFCHWQGVLCGHRHQRVTHLNLKSSNLKGSISPSIGNLSFLRVIDLSNNSFGGELPKEVSQLFRLQELVLEKNLLVGPIPTGLSNCSHLKILNLAYNEFSGNIPFELGFLQNLVQLNLLLNKLDGFIPPHLGNISSLQVLNISGNKLVGHIPASLGQLKGLTVLAMSVNMLSGTIPRSLFNLSQLKAFVINDNKLLEGSFPRDIGLTFSNIKIFRVYGNQLGGSIPVSFSNMSKIEELDISFNNFLGGLPSIFGNFKELMWVDISDTNLGTGKDSDLDFFTSFTNCSNLIILELQQNNFGGALPESVGNLSATLEILSIEGNQISGNIPPSIGNIAGLNALVLDTNQLTGTIPPTIGQLHKLVKLYLGSNKLSGIIPSSFGNLTLLNELRLGENSLHGSIPPSLGNIRNLQLLHLYDNSLNGTIPPQVLGLSSLSLSVALSGNNLTGPLPPEVGNLIHLVELQLSHNQLTGKIPSSLGECTGLQWLGMDHNKFDGTIDSLKSLQSIEEIDLSHNNFSGRIPEDFAKLKFLSNLDLSFNNLEGEVPNGGVFNNVSANISLANNDKLCGGIATLHLAKCSKKSPGKQNLSLAGKLSISLICGLLGVCLLSYFLINCWFGKVKTQPGDSESSRTDIPFMNISYGELFKATNGFSQDNVIGAGSFGSVYKGILRQHQLAVKVFNLERRGASKSFMAECETLRNIRHRNLVKIITACSGVDYQGNDFKALVYEFMPNGSLESWLHPYPQPGKRQRRSLSLSQRLNIVIDVASAVDYLHNHGEQPIIHCDLKPSNILLDQDMTTCVGDFGLSKFIEEENVQVSRDHTSSVGIRGTIGYAAPEYGLGSKVSTQGDVYSFGILLLEIFTGKKPTDSNLEDGMNLHQFVKMALPERVMEIVDPSLMIEGEEEEASSSSARVQTIGKIHSGLVSIFTVGVKCAEELPTERININDALKNLQKVKNMLLKDARKHN